jgi:hypothetical protein
MLDIGDLVVEPSEANVLAWLRRRKISELL